MSEKRYALNFCSNCGSRLNCEECVEPQTVGVDPQHPCEVGRAALASYQVYAEYLTNTGKYAAPQWVNGWCDDFRFGMPKEFRLGHALVEAGLMPKPCRHPVPEAITDGVCLRCNRRVEP